MAKRATIFAAIVLIVFSLIGSYLLSFFSITLEAFKIAGGIIVGSIGLKMIRSRREHFKTDKEKKDAIDKEDVSVIPLAIPMLSGPGAMAAAIVLMGQTTGIADILAIIIAIVSVCVLSYIILTRANLIEKRIGETGRKVIDKVMGLIVFVVGIQFIINGVEGLIRSWAVFF